MASGRRGVYEGVIEGMYQHWKHREIVKVITMQRKFSQVLYTAKLLQAESGGILISILKLKEGHAIIVYRGKNYRRPKSASVNLLSKRQALSRSLEIQRLGVSKFVAHLHLKPSFCSFWLTCFCLILWIVFSSPIVTEVLRQSKRAGNQ